MLEMISETQFETMRFLEWGIVPYEDALDEQLSLVHQRYEQKIPNTVIFCSHEPIVTKGRGTLETDIFGWKGLTIDVQRGGRATYHGPNQLVVYPIVNLQRGPKIFGIREYTTLLENAVIAVLADYGIQAVGGCGTKIDNQEATGVWIGSRKICSIGIGVKRWVTYHGLALNIDNDPRAFQGLNPCGFSSGTMISMEEILGRKVAHKEVIQKFKNYFTANIQS
jgi:lipoyl(octanoyl) transferase